MSYKYQLKNDDVIVTLTTLGAEMISLVDAEGTEYIWHADERYWKRHAPLLFPIVGKVLDGKYTVRDKEYQLPAHGFARDLEFQVEKSTHENIIFTLNSSLGTKAMYPFDFILKVIYTLKKKTLEITYEVTNQDHQTMYFKIGAHPGFMCPLFEGETMEDYYLTFEKEEEMAALTVTPDVYVSHETNVFKDRKIALNKAVFKDGPLIFANYKSKSMSLESVKHDKKLTVTFEGFPFLGIWSTTDEAPFVCIEPWHGHADFVDDSREMMHKKDIIALEAQKTFSCMHSISIS